MKVYHLSETLRLGDSLTPDYARCTDLARPFIQALEQSTDCFYGMVLNGKYLQAVLCKFGLREWSDYGKWATEGAFEYVRTTSFPDRCSRLRCCYFYDSLENSKALFHSDWDQAAQEDRAKVHLYEVDLQDDLPQRCDMALYDEAYNAMCQHQDVQKVLHCAHKYFAGEQSPSPIWELLSSKPARAVKDLTAYL